MAPGLEERVLWCVKEILRLGDDRRVTRPWSGTYMHAAITVPGWCNSALKRELP